jgi:hypothetical protein
MFCPRPILMMLFSQVAVHCRVSCWLCSLTGELFQGGSAKKTMFVLFLCVLFCSWTGELFQGGSATALLTLKCLPAIIIAMFGLRWALMTLV